MFVDYILPFFSLGVYEDICALEDVVFGIQDSLKNNSGGIL